MLMNILSRDHPQIDPMFMTSLVIQHPYIGGASRGFISKLRLDLVEISLKIIGFVLVDVAAAVLVVGTWVGIGSVEYRLTVSATLAFLGILAYLKAFKGLTTELHIDGNRQEIRLGNRDAGGVFRLIRLHCFEDLVSVFIRRSKNPGDMATLNIRVRSQPQPVKLMRGSEEHLLHYLKVIAEQHAAFRNDGSQVATKKTRRFIRSKLG